MLINYDSSTNKLSLDNPIITGTILFSRDEDKIEFRLSSLDLGSAQLKDNLFLRTIKEKNKHIDKGRNCNLLNLKFHVFKEFFHTRKPGIGTW